MAREVRFEYLKGIDAARALRRTPVVYLPIGAIERHGDHLPMGLDVLKAHAVCCVCARRIGGVVFPPHYYSGIALDPDETRSGPAARQRRQIGWYVANWCNLYTDATTEEHLFEVLGNLKQMGVRVAVLYSGHYPRCQREMIARLARRFNKSRKPGLRPAVKLAHTAGLRVVPITEANVFGTGDHAGLWETSVFMAVCPEQVDMRRLRPRNYREHRWSKEHDPRRATRAFGKKALSQIVAHVRAEIHCLLKR